MRRRAALAMLAGAVLAPFAGSAAAAARPFGVYYGAEDDPALAAFDLLVLDSDSHPPLAALRARAGRPVRILGYLSLVEVGAERPYREAVARQKLLLGENPDWPGSFYVDIRRREWQRRVVSELAPAILAAGFDGLFLDTLDDAAELEARRPSRHRGMVDAAVQLVTALRARLPGVPLMMNRALPLLPRVEGAIDAVLGESLLTTWDFKKQTCRWLPAEEYAASVRELAAARRRCPALAVHTLDYWDPEDAAGIARIYATQRAQGFVPYVATVGLDRVVAEPAA